MNDSPIIPKFITYNNYFNIFSNNFTLNSHENSEQFLLDSISIKHIKQIGNYKLESELGSGAFGKVVLAEHIPTSEKVAIKILDKIILSQTPEDLELVKQEMTILRIVKHKYIAQLYEILETPQHYFIIMEYCEGGDLLEYILHKTRLSEQESQKIFRQLINTLFYLHSQKISHRDIKIDNMLLDKNKNLKLVDFGLSTKYSDNTYLNQPCGTVVYAAPEVLEGNAYHGMLCDVWSSGIVLYGMLSGFLPFGDADEEVNKKNVLKGKIKFPSIIPDLAVDLLKHMLCKNQNERYTLQDIKEHQWFNMNFGNGNKNFCMIPGIIVGLNKIPIDEKILGLCENYEGTSKNKIKKSVLDNKNNEDTALYYLLVKKLGREGKTSVSDLCSQKFIDFVNDEKNIIRKEFKNNNNNNSKNLEIDLNNKENNKKENKIDFIKNLKNKSINITNNTNNSNNESKKNINNKFSIIPIPVKKNNKLIKDLNTSSLNNNNNTIDNNFIKISFPSKNNNKTIEISNNSINNNNNNKSHSLQKNEVKNIRLKKLDNNNLFDKKDSNNNDNNNNQIDSINNEKKNNSNINFYIKNNRNKNNIIHHKNNNSLIISSNNINYENLINNKNKISPQIYKNNIKNNKNNNQIINNIYLKNHSVLNSALNSTKKDKNIKHLSMNNNNNINNNKFINKCNNNSNNSSNNNNNNNNYSISSRNNSSKNDAFKLNIKHKNILNKHNNNNNNLSNISTNSYLNQSISSLLNGKEYFYNLYNTNKQTSNKINNNINNNNTNFSKLNLSLQFEEVLNSETFLYSNKKNNFINVNNNNRKKNNFINLNINNNNNNIYNYNFNNSKSNKRNNNNIIKNFCNKNQSLNVSMDSISKLYNIKSKKNKQRCLSQKENNYLKKIDYLNKKKINNNIEKNNSNLNHSVYDSNINISKKYEKKLLLNKRKNKNNNNINKNYLIYNNINNNNNKLNNNNFSVIFNNNNNNNNNNSHLNTSYSCKKIISENYNILNIKNKINNNVTNKKYKIEKRNDNFYLKNLPKHFESSVITYRKKSPYNIRDLSNSPSNKFLNEKTRLSRIPWKIKKKGIDLDMNNDLIYYKYLQKIKRPIKINKANKKINFKIDNNLHNNNNININYKFNNNNNISKINNDNINNDNNYFNNNSLNSNNNNNNISIHVNQINIINSYENNLNYFKDFYLPIYNGPIDISCIRTKEKNLNDCIKNITNKIKKFNFFYHQTKQNQFRINNKNGTNSITIEICKLINNNNNFLYNNNNINDLFYYKIENKKKENFNFKDFHSFLNDLLEND